MVRRAILGLVPSATAVAVCALAAMVGVGAVWLPLVSKHPDDPSIFDTLAWVLIYAAPLWIPLLLIVFVVTWVIVFFLVRRRL
jgi:hypothetical protein